MWAYNKFKSKLTLLKTMDKCSLTLRLSTVKECKYLKPRAWLSLKRGSQESGIDYFKMYP